MNEDSTPAPRAAMVAFGLSVLVPGLGHWYLGQLRVAVTFAVLFTGLLPVVIVTAMLTGVDAGITIWGVGGIGWLLRVVASVHAAWRAPSCLTPRTKAQTVPGYLAFALIVGALGALSSGSVRELVLEPYSTPSMSGAPSLVEGDHFAIAKLTERDRAAHRGDLVVFPYPDDPNEQFIKRVLGLPGETIEIGSGAPSVDGVALQWSECDKGGELPPRTRCVVERTPEGIRYPLWITETIDDPEPHTYTVPEGHVFVVGDNRSRSHDSREFGSVPRTSILGRAVARWLPLERSGTLIPDGAP